MDQIGSAQREVLDNIAERRRLQSQNPRQPPPENDAGAGQSAGQHRPRAFVVADMMVSEDEEEEQEEEEQEEGEQGDVVQELYELQMPRLWKQYVESEQQLAQTQDSQYDAENCCPICHIVVLASPPQCVTTFLDKILAYDQTHCLRMSDEHICRTITHSFNEYFLPRFRSSEAVVRQLPRWSSADYYKHFISPSAHDNTNVLRQLLRLHRQTQSNIEDLNGVLWATSKDAGGDNRRLCLEAQKQCLNATKLQLTLTNTLHQTYQRVRNSNTADQQRASVSGGGGGSIAIGYNIADDKRYRGRLVKTML